MLLINIDVLCKDVVKNSCFNVFVIQSQFDNRLQFADRFQGSLFCHSELIFFELLARGKIGASPNSVSSA